MDRIAWKPRNRTQDKGISLELVLVTLAARDTICLTVEIKLLLGKISQPVNKAVVNSQMWQTNMEAEELQLHTKAISRS